MPDMLDVWHPNIDDFRLPQLHAPWIHHINSYMPILNLFHQFEVEKRYPEYLWGQHPLSHMTDGYLDIVANTIGDLEDKYYRMAIEKLLKWYDIADTFHAQNYLVRDSKTMRNG